MSTYIDSKTIENAANRRVWSVPEFARRYRLDKTEEDKLLALLGPFALEHELLMNAQRRPVFR
ncbi:MULTISPECIES: hypothetical protein [Rhizobium]|uniref:Uncharacterized protein n=1 Tax=Rhizobium rhododendri TaxID=2506430 RepID=A0ABY8IK85_9HYPH|nr:MULTISPECIES: hypothetical protein [Rhizobium]MBZ5760073.1 hypothetical protein [Rhizobium sp. VS19-DR96]MBZ5766446.1 hypothetical protein [Rhizobium sp. VS19-DR129.2]MBZ5774211.1 hypothetical protein [Rhizobium sp. VS19-DRK62.2]MBZ5785283.1 hypothetical protein [Rhizobium sp. VS19-DR121]MBZ5802882.1 hypothetical protein [Rhizobium sp. VS19-DR181]